MSDGTWIDPWLRIREKTEKRNDMAEIATCYAKMSRLASAQLKRLEVRPKTRPETLDGLREIVTFCNERYQPLYDQVALMDATIAEETEKLNHE